MSTDPRHPTRQPDDSWVWVKTPEEAIRLLEQGNVVCISPEAAHSWPNRQLVPDVGDRGHVEVWTPRG